MNNRDLAEQVRCITAPIVESLGFELIETEYTNEHGRWIMRLYIESNDHPVNLGDCERVSKTVSSLLDVEDIIPGKYSLEVSSPGSERPVRRTKDFQKFIGLSVKVKTLNKINERRNFTGTIKNVENGKVTVEEENRTTEIPIEGILKARLINTSRSGGNSNG